MVGLSWIHKATARVHACCRPDFNVAYLLLVSLHSLASSTPITLPPLTYPIHLESKSTQLQLTQQLKQASNDLQQSRDNLRSQSGDLFSCRARLEGQSRDLDVLLRERQQLSEQVRMLNEKLQGLDSERVSMPSKLEAFGEPSPREGLSCHPCAASAEAGCIPF